KEVAEMPSLWWLTLPNGISPTGFAHLKNLPNLQVLELAYTFGDEIVEAVATFKQLRLVATNLTKITDGGAQKLQKALPDAVILHPGVAPSEAECQSVRWALANQGKLECYLPDG